MFTIGVYALALALAWAAIVGRLTVENLVVGFVIGLIIVMVGPKPPPLKPRRVPGQLVALLFYVLILLRDIILSPAQIFSDCGIKQDRVLGHKADSVAKRINVVAGQRYVIQQHFSRNRLIKPH